MVSLDWCLSTGVGYVPAPDFTFSLFFIFIPHTTDVHYKNNYTYSHPNLTSFSIKIQIHIPHVTWSAQEERESKIDHTNAIREGRSILLIAICLSDGEFKPDGPLGDYQQE